MSSFNTIPLPLPHLSVDSARSTSSAVAMNAMFRNATRFDQDVGNWNVGSVQFFQGMFSYAESFSGDVSGWDVGSARDMNSMFFVAPSFSSDVSQWVTSRVTDMTFMFAFATGFGSDVSSWDVSQVTAMNGLFAYTPTFNSDVSGWNVRNVQNMTWAFLQAPSFQQNLCPWGLLLSPDTGVTEMFDQSGCPLALDPDFTAVPPGPFCFACEGPADGQPTVAPVVPPPQVTGTPTSVPAIRATLAPTPVAASGLTSCFASSTELSDAVDGYLVDPADAGLLSTYGPIEQWCVSGITDFSNLFSVVRNPLAATFNANIAAWDMSNAQDVFRMFDGARQFNQGLSSWNGEYQGPTTVNDADAISQRVLFLFFFFNSLPSYRFRRHVQQCYSF